MADYIALIYKDEDSDYGVSFPDFPGCITAGSTLDEARALAAEALQFHVEGLAEDGTVIPAPSPLDAVMAERENRDAVAFLVPLKTPAARAVRVNVTLAEDTLAAIDRYAEAHGYTRSGFIAAAARRVMAEEAA
ncbi:MAG TPA: type II toxin-antitoxin system HicB family antitoxin [Stellaceae bacterium]|nr:type II toxin-antitoxin system HicB family antitoxin [Stellaceae bacterium]